MRVVVLVPIRYGKPERDRLWEFCRPRWAEFFPDWPVYEGVHGAEEGPFNRSLAVNRAAEAAGEWDVAVVIDNDVVADPQAVRAAVEVADQTGRLVVAHDERIMLTDFGTKRVMRGEKGSWRASRFVERIWGDSVSCVVAVARRTWDEVGGFDPGFVGWGREDTAFRIACEAVSGPILKVSAETFHLWHPVSPEAASSSPLRQANEQRHQAYVAARWDREKVLALRQQVEFQPVLVGEDGWAGPMPRVIHRTVAAHREAVVDRFWRQFGKMYPDWELRSWEEPLNPADFPVTSPLWAKCQSGAQKAGLVRLELLWTHGGIYVDSDVEPLRRMDELLSCRVFGAWEDANCVPDAVLGAVPGHPAVAEMLNMAAERLLAGKDAWHTGPGVTTTVMPGRADVTVLPPGAFYPYHYLEKSRAGENFRQTSPWSYCVHHWHGSWLTPEQKDSQAKRQRS